MLVYHFVPVVHGIDNIQNLRVKISQLNKLNAPFDLLSPYCADAEFRATLHANISLAEEKVGIICFSRDWHNPVQWTHYADQHRGMCLGFEVDAKAVRSVEYVKNRPIIDWRTWDYGAALSEKLTELAYRKFEHWRYEDEVRSVINLTDPDVIRDKGYFFVPIGDELKLKRVILGARCPQGKAAFIDMVGPDSLQGIELWRARMAFRTFRIVRQNNPKLWP